VRSKCCGARQRIQNRLSFEDARPSHAHRHRQVAAESRERQNLARTGCAETWKAPHQLADRETSFQASERRAETDVDPGRESDVPVLLPADVDLSKLRRGSIGIPARWKLPIQFVFAIPVAWIALGSQSLWWLPLAVIAVVAGGNAVNITDGMDGLAAGLSIIAIGVTVLFVPGAQPGEKAVAMTLCGGLGGFLIFNRYPARVFMGDTGSLAIGFALAAMAIQQGWMLLLPLIGLVFVLETLSVIIQVAYFKVSGGRRVFKMTPIHYTFHHEGWSERRIALSFWTAGLVGALAAFGVARLVS